MIGRRAFLAGGLGALGACAAEQAPSAFWPEPPGRRPMRWKVRHSLQVEVNDNDLRLAKQLGLEYVHTWSTPAKYRELVDRVEAAGLNMAKIGNTRVHKRTELCRRGPARDERN